MPRPLADMFFVAVSETLVLVLCAGCAALLLGIPLGLALHAASRQRAAGRRLSLPARLFSLAMRAVQATPAIIILAAAIPLTHLLLGTAGVLTATLIPLILLATTFMARRAAQALDSRDDDGQPDRGIREQLRNAGPAIAAGAGLMLAVLVGYAALAGALSGAGLGGFGLRHGYQEFRPLVLLAVAVTLLVLAETGQVLGQALAHRLGGADPVRSRASFTPFRRNR